MSSRPRSDCSGEIVLPDRLSRAEVEVVALRTSLERRTAQPATVTETLGREAEKRRRAEAVQRRGEERYRSLAEAATAIVWNAPAPGQFKTTLGASEATSMAQQIEALACRGDCPLEAAHRDLVANLSRFRPVLAEYRRTP